MDREYLDRLKSRYVNASSEKEREEVRKAIHDACDQDPEAVAVIAVEQLQETIQKIDGILIRQQMKEVLPFVSLAYIAKMYFRKSRQWLYQRINGLSVNGKPAQFTPTELETLNFALQDMARKLSATHVSA
ncbi:MAG: DUF5053 domain-containing protein [Bacteroidales bacterium]|nr:DUF5053 domain-containing protein [Bacteroidales bacterium]